MKTSLFVLCTAFVTLFHGAVADDCADLGVPTQCSLTSGCQTCYAASKSPEVFCAAVGSSSDGMPPAKPRYDGDHSSWGPKNRDAH